MEQRNRLLEIDSLRGLAALSVLFYHYTTFYNTGYEHIKVPYYLDFKYGFFGVQLFFIISGFVIYMTILKSSSVKEFVLKRAIRLYPAFIISALVSLTMISSFGLPGMEIPLKDAMLNLTMIQNIIPWLQFDLIDGSYWSLTVEIYFYLVCSVLLSIGLIKRTFFVALTAILAIYVIRILYLNNLIHPVIGDHTLIIYGNLFIAGIMFYKLRNDKSRKYHAVILLTLVYQYIIHGINSGLIVTLFYLIFYILIKNKLRLLENKILTFFGTISYSLYLIHQQVGYIIINFIESRGLIHEIFIIVPTLVSIILATFITFYLEKPIQKHLLAFFYKRKEKINKNKQVVSA